MTDSSLPASHVDAATAVEPVDISRGWLAALEEQANAALPPHIREYVGTTAGSAERAARDLAEWDAVSFAPRTLLGERSLDLGTTVLGRSVSSPVLIAPMAQQVGAHPAGERATAAAAAAVGTVIGVSTNTAVPFGEIQGTGAEWWFQVYPLADRAATERIVERAAAAGAAAIILTVDTTALLVSAPGIEPTEWPEGPERARLVNLTAAELAGLEGRPTVAATLDDIAWLTRASGGLPVIVKGVLRGDDATRAVDAGASAVIVSTHGGRRSGASISSLSALPSVVGAVGDAAEVYVDSGVRSGGHALVALTLGAQAVFVGRPVMWGLALSGAAGVERVLRGLNAELTLALSQSGATSLAGLSTELTISLGSR
ncbi:alpha-hydroxy-acid oxidizing enzyme [Labedella populi]|uniref:Alpha-hydroxy-acid oxidizing enzyme n=1 Tax=Labedella populi TaxID=2498850 RepID=A0A3S3ZW65_9MICO|nr:alpha-hydroxy acid oxidase [Labedella populi]RWZ67956.1 alpha-hydroxy-acid oxidizing enzyme [Labedella populi]